MSEFANMDNGRWVERGLEATARLGRFTLNTSRGMAASGYELGMEMFVAGFNAGSAVFHMGLERGQEPDERFAAASDGPAAGEYEPAAIITAAHQRGHLRLVRDSLGDTHD